MKKLSTVSLAIGMMMLAGGAHADLMISPEDAECTYSLSTAATQDEPQVEKCAYVQANSGANGSVNLTEVFKQDVGGGETGSAAGWYTAAVNAEGGTITWDGPNWLTCPECWLVVKDGNADPVSYFFDLWRLSTLTYDLDGENGDNDAPFPSSNNSDDVSGWDGKTTLSLSGFWPNQGGISHVAIFTAPTTSTTNTTNTTNTTSTTSNVPEPASMLLIGTALLGLGFARRRFA